MGKPKPEKLHTLVVSEEHKKQVTALCDGRTIQATTARVIEAGLRALKGAKAK